MIIVRTVLCKSITIASILAAFCCLAPAPTEASDSLLIVTAVDATAKTVSLQDRKGEVITYRLTPFTRITSHDRPATLDKIQEGMNADIVIGNNLTLSKINLTGTATPAGPTYSIMYMKGRAYKNFRFGAVSEKNGTVQVIHEDGISEVVIEDMPKKYRGLFNYAPSSEPATEQPVATQPTPMTQNDHRRRSSRQPQVTTQPTQPAPMTQADRDWEQYNADRKTKVLYHGKLADIAAFKQVVGFIVGPDGADLNGIRVNGTLIELAEPINQTSQPVTAMSLRPNLWKKTGKMILLRDYKAVDEVDMIIRVPAVTVAMAGAYPLYEVAMEPTFEQWKKLRPGLSSFSRAP